MSDLDFTKMDAEFEEFQDTLKQTTKNLKRLGELVKWRWQIQGMDGFPEWYEAFEKAMQEAQQGWMSSMC